MDVSRNPNNSISIQNAPFYNEVSIQQNRISQHDISLQNVPFFSDEGAQIGVDVKNVSAQYSAKPVFENVSQDFMSDGD